GVVRWSEVGVVAVSAGVAKANSVHVVIAGHDGGTGSSPVSSIHSAGVPWEIGLAETQQTLVKNRLRDRITVQTDGQLKTGRDVVVAALLGAEEFGFATAPLIAMGCIMMRACHLNTCPVGIATQDPELRQRFAGRPEHVVNYFFFIAEEVRQLMAQLGVRRFDELIGRTDLLEADEAIDHWKAKGVDLTNLLAPADAPSGIPRRRVRDQDPVLDAHLDHALIELAQPALENGEPVELGIEVQNRHRTVGGLLSGEVARRHGADGLPDDTIVVHAQGSGGQSFGAWLAPGVTIDLEGDANDFAGGMSGGIAYVLDRDGGFAERCNTELVELETPSAEDFEEIRELVEEHRDRTGSALATSAIADWEGLIGSWVKVMPTDYRRALAEQATRRPTQIEDEDTPWVSSAAS